MAVTKNSALGLGIGTGATTVQQTITSVPAGATIIALVHNRSNETAVINSIASDVDGAWTPDYVNGPVDATSTTARGWMAYRHNNTAGTHVITVTFDGAINSQLALGWISSDAGVMSFEGAATVLQLNATTDADSNTLAVSDAGCIIGGVISNNAQNSPEPTIDGTGEEALTSHNGGRSFLFFEDFASGGTYGFELTLDSTAGMFFVGSFLEPTGDPPPTITDVDEDNTILDGQEDVEIDGTDFDVDTVHLVDGSLEVEQTITGTPSATSVTFDANIGTAPGVRYGARSLRLTNLDAQSDSHSITINPPTGKNYVDLSGTLADPEDRLESSADLEAGDQVEWSNVVGGTIGDVTVNIDGSFSAEAGVTAFDFRVHNVDDGWGSIETQTIGPAEEPPTITTTTLPDGNIGTPYSQVLAADGDEPFSWALDSGDLPDGLSLTSEGEIEGTPTTLGSETFTVEATNAFGSDTQELTLEVLPPGPTITTTTLPNGFLTIPYSQVIEVENDTDATFSVQAGALPDGLTIGAATGIISGTPTVEDSFDFTIRVTTDGGTDDQAFTVEITEFSIPSTTGRGRRTVGRSFAVFGGR